VGADGSKGGYVGSLVDVNRRHTAESDLARFFELSPDALCVVDFGGIVHRASPALARMLQTDIGRLEGLPLVDFVDPDDLAGVEAAVAPLAAGQVIVQHENRFRRPDGEAVWVEWTAAPLPNSRRFYAVGRDTTDRHETERALRESEARLRHLIEHATDIIYETDELGRFTYFNPVAVRLMGYAEHEMLGMSYVDMIAEDARAATIACYLNQIRSRTETTCLEFPSTTKDGRRLWFGHMARLKIEHGRYVGISAVARDVTERRRAEEALRDTLARLEALYDEADQARAESRTILDASRDAMVLIVPGRGFVSVKRRFTEMFAMPADQVIGWHVAEVLPHVRRVFTDGESVIQALAAMVLDRERYLAATFEQRWPERRELELTSAPVHTADGSYLGRLLMIRDVTREREVDRMKTEFVSLVSRELRTPLTAIAGYVELLVQGEVGPLTDDQRDFLVVVKTNADRLTGLINDLLDISRIEAGRLELRREPLDLPAALRLVAESFRPLITAKQQTIALEVADALPHVWGDPERVGQIVTNLVSNAHKYTPAGGEIHVGAEEAGDGLIRVWVRDTGMGMSEEERA
jgi:PAS domain S-box-containing protein